MMNKIVTVLAYLVALLMIGVSVRWQIDPDGAAAELGMPLLEGLGRSTQIGDMTAFFLVAGAFGLAGLIKRNATLLYTPLALVSFAAIFRTLAWLMHDAALAPQIALEIVMAVILLLAIKGLSAQTQGDTA